MNLKIVSLFANKNEDGIYGDIYTSLEDCRNDHPNDEALVGFGVVDEDSGYLVDESDDFYPTEAEAQQFIDKQPGAGAAPQNISTCDMTHSCPEPVTHMDRSGFLYCTAHGLQRRTYQPCRKLRPHELNRLQRGELITKY